MIDITKAIQAKSDQLNADDLIAGPRVIRISGVELVGGEQPVIVRFDGDGGRPWKPSKSALRALAACWGPDAEKWIGLHCTIYNEPTVRWAGQEVGGIRVSHAEGLAAPRKLMLAHAKGRKGAVVIEPLSVDRAGDPLEKWRKRLHEVAAGGETAAKNAWSQVKSDIRAALGDGFEQQLLQIARAADAARAADPAAAINAALDE